MGFEMHTLALSSQPMPALSQAALVSGWLDGSAANTVEATTKAHPETKIEAIAFIASLRNEFFQEPDVTWSCLIRQSHRSRLRRLIPKYLPVAAHNDPWRTFGPIQRSRRDLYKFAIMLTASARSPSLRASAIVVRSRTFLVVSATLAKTGPTECARETCEESPEMAARLLS